MPFPVGHTAIGLAICETVPSKQACRLRIFFFIYIVLLTNLPDIDILIGLIFQGNGAAYHRGPTHSLLFALLFGFLASNGWRLWRWIPRMGCGLCSLMIFSHVAADMFLTGSPVSLLWPLEIYWSPGHSTWGQVIDMVLFQGLHQDAGIAIAVLIYLIIFRFFRGATQEGSIFAFARKQRYRQP